MQAHILYLHTHFTPVQGSNVNFFLILIVVMLYIKLKEMEHRAPCKHIFCPYTQPQSQIGSKVQTFIFLKVSKGAKIRNRYNQVPHLTRHTKRKVTNSQ